MVGDKCANLRMCRCADFLICGLGLFKKLCHLRFGNISFAERLIHRSTDSPIHRSTDSPINRFTDQPIHRSTDSPINRFTDQLINIQNENSKNMKKIFLIVLCLSFAWLGFSQEATFSVFAQPDTLLLGNQLQVTFKLENGNSQDFTPPEFEGLTVVAGPNISSSMVMNNGAISQSISYSYFLDVEEVGVFFIPPAKITTEEGDLFTEPLEIVILPNPEGIIQKAPSTSRSFGWDSDFFRMPESIFPSIPKEKPTPKKKKRKTYKL